MQKNVLFIGLIVVAALGITGCTQVIYQNDLVEPIMVERTPYVDDASRTFDFVQDSTEFPEPIDNDIALEKFQEYLDGVELVDLQQISGYPDLPDRDNDVLQAYYNEVYSAEWFDGLSLDNLTHLIDEEDIEIGLRTKNGYYLVVNSLDYSGTNPTSNLEMVPEDYYGIYYSLEGDLWDRVATFERVVYLASCPADPNIMYAGFIIDVGGGSQEIEVNTYKSDDAGGSWSPVENSAFRTATALNTFFVDYNDCNAVYSYDLDYDRWKHSEMGGSYYSNQ